MTDPDLIRALSPIIRAFEQSSIPYYIGGSLASSVYGIARAAIDVDLVAGIEMYHVDSLKTRLQAELEERKRSIPIHSIRPHQLIEIEELEEQIGELEKKLERD